MSLDIKGGHPAHYPNNPDKFEFDAEVSQVFPDMARKSIPLFYETHDLHAALCRPWVANPNGLTILDVGASRGAFVQALSTHCPEVMDDCHALVDVWDISPDMCEHLQKDFPWARVKQSDIVTQTLPGYGYDIINCTYVLQFVRPENQLPVLRKLVKSLHPGGVLFLGQKMQTFGPAGRMLHEQYIQFRMSNGYSREEIEAKTHALSNSMWPLPDQVLVDYLNKYGLQVTETSRWTVFNNYMCTKGL